LVADCMTDEQAPSSRRIKEIIVTGILFCFTSVVIGWFQRREL